MCFVLTLTNPQPQSHDDVEDDGLDEDHSESQDGQRHEVHLWICKQHDQKNVSQQTQTASFNPPV